jgi:hypothetical protein
MSKAENVDGEERDWFVLLPVQIVTSQSDDGFGLRRRPSGLQAPNWTTRAVLKPRQFARVVAAQPPVEGVPSGAEVVGIERPVAAVKMRRHVVKVELDVIT